MRAFDLAHDEPIQLAHLCVCVECGMVYGPLRYFESRDGISRMHGCDNCDPQGTWKSVVVSNVGDFVGAGLRTLIPASAKTVAK